MTSPVLREEVVQTTFDHCDCSMLRRFRAPVAAVRIRPWLANEDASVETVATPTGVTSPAVEVRAQGEKCLYPSHFVFSPNHPQASVYKELMTDIIGEAIASGRGGSIVACGPVGSGKSHTLLGYGGALRKGSLAMEETLWNEIEARISRVAWPGYL
eukprot:Skav211696  [mRNA]  locus=scaffold1535:14098:21724:+ [translate_table: standard]